LTGFILILKGRTEFLLTCAGGQRHWSGNFWVCQT